MKEMGMAGPTGIMIVEDEAIVSADIEMKLRRLGYSVAAVATSGKMAVEKAQEACPRLALMDIRLSGPMDGIEAAKVLEVTGFALRSFF